MKKFIIGLAASLFLLTACASIGGSGSPSSFSAKIADEVAPVDDQYRPLRVCLLAAGVVEVMTDRVQTFDGTQAPNALGRLMALQGAIDTAKMASPLWLNTDMADVSFQFSKVLKDAGREKLGRVLLGGPTLGNFINVAQRATLLTSKGDALLADINSMLRGVNAGTLPEADAWAACEERIAQNRRVLGTLAGVRTQ